MRPSSSEIVLKRTQERGRSKQPIQRAVQPTHPPEGGICNESTEVLYKRLRPSKKGDDLKPGSSKHYRIHGYFRILFHSRLNGWIATQLFTILPLSHSPPYLYRPIHRSMLSWNAFILISSFIMISWPSRYEIGGVVSMHPTVLYCSPMKERDEALREEANSREGEFRING